MHKLFQKVLALLGFIQRVTPMIDDSVEDVTKVFQTTQQRLEALKVKKEKAQQRIEETREALKKEWVRANDDIAKADKVSNKIKEIFE